MYVLNFRFIKFVVAVAKQVAGGVVTSMSFGFGSLKKLRTCYAPDRSYKTFFKLNSTENEISTAHKK